MGDFDKFSGCQFGNLQVDPPINGGDLELANGCYGGRAGDTNVPCASYTSNDLDEILDAAKSMEMQKNPSTASGNLHVGPGLVVDDFKLAISRNGGGFGDMSVHSTPYPTSNNSYAVLDEAKSMVEQLIPHPQFPPASMKTHPHLSKSKDPLDLTQSFLQDDEKVPHDMPILPCEIAAGNSPNVSMFSQGLIKNDLPTGGALFTSTGGRNGNAALTSEEKKQLRASRNREYAKQSRLRAKKKEESLRTRVPLHRKKNRELKATLDGYYQILKSKQEKKERLNNTKESKSGAGPKPMSIPEAFEIAEETMKEYVWTCKTESNS